MILNVAYATTIIGAHFLVRVDRAATPTLIQIKTALNGSFGSRAIAVQHSPKNLRKSDLLELLISTKIALTRSSRFISLPKADQA